MFFSFVYFILGGTFESFDLLIVPFTCLVVVPLNIGWLTSLVDYSVNIVMSLVSHGSLYIHLVHLIFLLRLCVNMDDILMLCMTDCCMTTSLLLDCMLLVYVGHTFIPLSPSP